MIETQPNGINVEILYYYFDLTFLIFLKLRVGMILFQLLKSMNGRLGFQDSRSLRFLVAKGNHKAATPEIFRITALFRCEGALCK